jgi:hypothetical protein
VKPGLAAIVAITALPMVMAGCGTGGHSGTSAGQPTVTAPPGRPGPPIVSVTCRDAPPDAATLQRVINTSPAGSTIAIGGPVCLLTRGVTLREGRTYTAGSMAGTILRQDAAMPFVLASASYVPACELSELIGQEKRIGAGTLVPSAASKWPLASGMRHLP